MEYDPSVVFVPDYLWNDKLDTLQSGPLYLAFYADNLFYSVTPGNYIITAADGGHIFKVTDIQYKSSRIFFSCVDASLTEVFRYLNISFSHRILPDKDAMNEARLADGVEITQNDNNLHFTFDRVLYDEDQDKSTVDDQFRLQGTVDLAGMISSVIKVSNSKLKEFSLTLDALQTTEMNAILTQPGINFAFEDTLLELPLPDTIINKDGLNGLLPLVISPSLKILAGASVYADTAIECGMKQTLDLSAGTVYEHDGWSDLHAWSTTFEADPPDIYGNTSVRPYIRFVFTYRIDNMLVSDLVSNEYYRVHSDVGSSLKTIYAGNKANVSVTPQILSKSAINYSAILFGYEDLVYPSDSPQNLPPAISLTCSPVSLFPGDTCSFSLTGSSDDNSGPGDLTYRFDWNGNGIWDTQFLNGLTMTHSFNASGMQTVRVEGKDLEGLSGFDEVNLRVSEPVTDLPPKPSLWYYPSNPTVNATVTFDASGSFDDHTNSNEIPVRWDLDGDGSWDTGWKIEKTTTSRFSTGGDHTVKIEIRDRAGQISKDSCLVQVPVPCPFDTGKFLGIMNLTEVWGADYYEYQVMVIKDPNYNGDKVGLIIQGIWDGTWNLKIEVSPEDYTIVGKPETQLMDDQVFSYHNPKWSKISGFFDSCTGKMIINIGSFCTDEGCFGHMPIVYTLIKSGTKKSATATTGEKRIRRIEGE